MYERLNAFKKVQRGLCKQSIFRFNREQVDGSTEGTALINSIPKLFNLFKTIRACVRVLLERTHEDLKGPYVTSL